MARLDRLGAAARETAQVGAAIGRETSARRITLIALFLLILGTY
jgi:hypothetical protein